MDLGLKGKRALVMAASKGLGKSIAEALVKEGVTVAICSHDKARIETTAELIGAIPFEADLSQKAAVSKLISEVTGKLGGIDILVINNGGPPHTTFDTTTDEQWRSTFEALFMLSVDAIKSVLPGMLERKWGRVLFVTSTGAKETLENLILSNSFRSGLHGLINALSKEYARHGVTFNAVMPGMFLTERITNTIQKMNLDQEQLTEKIPAGRLGQPAELAALFTFLASEQAGYITGQAIACDGGLTRGI